MILMNVKYINPFIQASSSVLKSVINMDTSMGKIYLKTPPYPSSTVAIVIGLIGDMKGQVIISMDT